MQDEEISIEENSIKNTQNDSGDQQPAVENSESDLNPSQEAKTPRAKNRPARKERHSPTYENFLKSMDELSEVEAKIQCAIAFMEKAIAQENAADFKAFWDARMKCLSLFKENVPPFLRTQLWTKFSELSKEARRLKDMLDEQSDFAAEQIDMAITAIETGLDQLSDTLNQEADLELPPYANALRDNFGLYNGAQRELAHLNLFASRITSLRKELIKTEMRVRIKNKFFERMSKAGDRVFPRRKVLIQEISQAFSDDIHHFIERYFGSQDSRISLFDLREEIKALQSAAKNFTLNTHAFSQTRLQLSECWDKLKEKDKERKVEFDKRRGVFKQNELELKAKIDEAAAKFEAAELSHSQASNLLDEIVSEMRDRELGRDELKALRELIAAFRDKINHKQKAIEEERLKQEEVRLQQKRELFESYKAKCLALLSQAENKTADELTKEKELIIEEVQKSALSKLEKNEIEKVLKPLKDILRAKREQALLKLPTDERLALEQLKQLLSEKREHRQEIKERLEHYRKLLGSSGLSFEKSFDYTTKVSEEKENYDKAQEAVREIEGKIETLESKLS